MRAGLGVLIVIVIALPELARSQANPDTDTSLVITIHPDVSTILQLPDEIVHTWIDHHGEIMVARVGNELAIRPRAGIPAGVEASLEVQTRTVHQTFQLRVVARARDAHREFQVPPADAQIARESTPGAPFEAPTKQTASPAEPVAGMTAEPTVSAPTGASSSVPAPEEAESCKVCAAESPPRTALSPPIDLSLHALAGLGFTGLEIAGYQPLAALQRHHTLGLRLVGASRGHWLSLGADVSAELPAGPMLFGQAPATGLQVTGARLRAELSAKASLGTIWIPSAYAAFGLQVHLRRAVDNSSSPEPKVITTMERGAVLGLGLGLQYRARSTLLGVDFQVRQGGPDGYFSVTTLLTLGRILDQGE